EPLGVEEVLAICERERPEGVVIQFGGQTPLRLARALEEAGTPILGTPFEAVDLAEDRERFAALLDELGIRCPEWEIVSSGRETLVAAVMQHVEEAGVHSGDSACVLPAPSLDAKAELEIREIVARLGPALGTVGLLNVQLAVADGEVFVLEANPRASRTVPFASKATGVNLVRAACRLALGEKLSELALPPERPPAQVSVKAAVLPFHRFPGSDPVLGPEI